MDEGTGGVGAEPGTLRLLQLQHVPTEVGERALFVTLDARLRQAEVARVLQGGGLRSEPQKQIPIMCRITLRHAERGIRRRAERSARHLPQSFTRERGCHQRLGRLGQLRCQEGISIADKIAETSDRVGGQHRFQRGVRTCPEDRNGVGRDHERTIEGKEFPCGAQIGRVGGGEPGGEERFALVLREGAPLRDVPGENTLGGTE